MIEIKLKCLKKYCIRYIPHNHMERCTRWCWLVELDDKLLLTFFRIDFHLFLAVALQILLCLYLFEGTCVMIIATHSMRIYTNSLCRNLNLEWGEKCIENILVLCSSSTKNARAKYYAGNRTNNLFGFVCYLCH